MKLFFHKMTKFNKNDSKGTSHFSFYIRKFKKWDRTLACIIGLLAFFTLMGIGIYSIFRHKNGTDCKPNHESSCDDKNEENPRKAPVSKFEVKCSTNISESCHVICSYIRMNESLGEHINAALLGIEPPCSKIRLELKYQQFAEAQLSNGWLKNVEPKVTILTIYYNNNLREINAQAFQGHPFEENLVFLRIEDTYITTLRKNSFLGLTSLNRFQIQGFNKQILEIEEEALTGMDNLTTLQVESFTITSKDMINLIGDKGVPQRQLQQLYVMYNFIPKLAENSFTNIKESVREINLIGSRVETIHKRTFSGMKNIEILALSYNNLKTLEDGTFSSLSNLIPEGLKLGRNEWNCTCSLQWLKNYFVNTNVIDTFTPPLCNNEIEFKDFEFCPTSGTNPDCTKIRKKLGMKILPCKNERSYPKYKSYSNDKFHSAEIIVEDQKVTLQLQELEGDPLEVKVMISKPIQSYYLIWTSLENKTQYGCQSSLENNLFLQLERDMIYTFSVLYLCEAKTSPECTFGVKTLPEWSLRTWISNKYQALAVGVTALVAICLIGVTTLATFICIRRYPKLISANKSVIIVKPKETEESAPSRELEEPQYWEPSTIPSTQGYRTPKYHSHRYARIKYRPPLMRSISELIRTRNTSFWRATHTGGQNPKLERSERVESIEVHAYQDYRPPLPLPNPGTSYGSSKELPEHLMYNSSV